MTGYPVKLNRFHYYFGGKKMKKTLIAAMMAAMCVPMFAAPKRATIKVWESDGPEKKFINWAIKEFPKSNPKYKSLKIVYEPVASTDSRAKIELDGPAGVGADIFVAPHDHIGALVNGGHVKENTMANFKADFIPAAQKGASYKGKVYGYPIGIETYGLFYNKALVKEPPKTWDELKAFAKGFNDKSQNKYACVWEVGNAYYDIIFMEGFGAELFGPNGNDRHQHNINSAAAIKGLKYFQNLRKEILDVPAADMSGDFCNSSFAEGKAAMVITGPWKIADYNALGINYGITTIPAFPGESNPPASFSGVRLAFVSEYTEYPEEAKAFAEFICSKAALEQRYQITKQIPPRRDISVNDPSSQGILEQSKYAKPMPTIPQMNTYWSSMNAAFSGVWDGDDVTSALTNAAAAMEAAK